MEKIGAPRREKKVDHLLNYSSAVSLAATTV